MSTAADKSKHIWRLVAVGYLAVFVILIVISQFLSGDAAVAIVSIPITIAVIAGIVAWAFKLSGRKLRNMPTIMADLRKQYPVAYAVHIETNSYGAVTIKGGELALWILYKGKSLTPYGVLQPGSYSIEPGRAQFAAARKVDGITVLENDSKTDNSFNLALSHDDMKLQGNLLKGQELADAIKKLQRASKAH